MQHEHLVQLVCERMASVQAELSGQAVMSKSTRSLELRRTERVLESTD